MAAARATASCPTGPQSGRWCASTSHDRQILSRRRAVRADARLELYDLCVPRGPPVEGGRAGAEADGGVADGEGFQATRQIGRASCREGEEHAGADGVCVERV